MEILKPEAILMTKSMGNLCCNPSGKYAAYLLFSIDEKENKYRHELCIYDIELDKTSILEGNTTIKDFAYIGDNRIVFISSCNSEGKKETDLSILNICSMQIEDTFSLPCQIIDVASNGVTLFFSAFEQSFGEENKNSSYISMNEYPYWYDGIPGVVNGCRRILFCYEIAAKRLEQISGSDFSLDGYNIFKNKALFWATPFSQKGVMDMTDMKLFVYDNETKATKEITPNKRPFVYLSAAFLDDAGIIYCGTDCLGYGIEQNKDYYSYNIETLQNIRLTSDIPVDTNKLVIIDSMYAIRDKDLISNGKGAYFLAVTGNTKQLFFIDRQGVLMQMTEINGCVVDFSVNGNEILLSIVTENLPIELYSFKKGLLKRITFHNKWAENYSIAPQIKFTTTDKEGVKTDGWIIKPLNYKEGGKYPVILHIHGGPNAIFSDAYSNINYSISACGYGVIFLNPRGSSGRGNAYADIRGKWGTIDYDNIMDFVDEAISNNPWMDKDRLGVTGASYGGFMTNWIVGHTERFRAAVSQRGISNWATFSMTTDIGFWFAKDQIEATIWENFQLLWEKSPLKYADKIKTPVLFIHPEQDYRCHSIESMQLYAALKYMGVDTEMVIFKNENHAISRIGKPMNRVKSLEMIIDWFDRYLK